MFRVSYPSVEPPFGAASFIPGRSHVALTRSDLEGRGYEGFVSFARLRNGELVGVPQVAGTYVVLVDETVPEFVEKSRGGHFKGKDPTVSADLLHDKWVEDANVVYIGKAENLQRRLKEFCRFGSGVPIGHWGGRYVWQVAGSDDWLVCWKPCDEAETALAAEASLLSEFAERHGGRLPFANLRR